MDGNRKKIKIDNPLYKLLIPYGEFTIREDPVVAVILSKIPAFAAEITKASAKKIAMYI